MSGNDAVCNEGPESLAQQSQIHPQGPPAPTQQQGLFHLHPGHIFLTTSLPLLALAYRDYRTPLETVVQSALLRRTGLGSVSSSVPSAAAASAQSVSASVSTSSIVDHLAAFSATASAAAATAEEDAVAAATRRAVASAVAFRALRVATFASCGTFGLVTACAFYLSNCTSVDEAITRTRNWAMELRRRVDRTLGIPSSIGRVDIHHPEIRAIQGMNEEEELDHIRKTYLSDVDDFDANLKPDTTAPHADGEGTSQNQSLVR